ncbi:ubiquitin-conjugating enzyme E2 E3 isoform X2 [Odocoileus virginianus]|uniref:Ubiquitin-conjugating enzyme E2 E3 isoform X2 n=2 Tax=Odocoileinae TaxID=9881 RepID=A0ABM4IW35_ODOVR
MTPAPACGAGSPMGSLAPEAGSGRKPPRGTAAPRDGARAPAFSGKGSAAKGGRGQSAGSPPRSLSGPRAGGRVRPPGEGRRGETARERAGRARARRPPAARAPPPVFQEITSPRCPVIGRGPMMRAPAPAAVVQMQTSETQPLQSLKNKKKENLLPPSRRKTPNSLAKPLLNYPLVLKEFRRS